MTKLEALQGALARLHKVGWTQLEFGSNVGPNCAIGALRFATAGRTASFVDYPREFSQAKDALEDVIGHDQCCVMCWNDDSTRTFEDVVIAFEQAIANEKARTP